MSEPGKNSSECCGKDVNRMSKFKGFEIVPAATFGCPGWSAIRITVSAKKVGLSRPLIDALGRPSSITFHKGIGENEGRMIIAAAEDAEEQNQIHINLENKKICFTESEFAAICAEMVQTYGRGSFKKGSYYSISGTKVDDDAYVFDFRDAVEHYVKVGSYGNTVGTPRQRQNTFSISDRNGSQDRVTAMPARPYSMTDRSAGMPERTARV